MRCIQGNTGQKNMHLLTLPPLYPHWLTHTHTHTHLLLLPFTVTHTKEIHWHSFSYSKIHTCSSLCGAAKTHVSCGQSVTVSLALVWCVKLYERKCIYLLTRLNMVFFRCLYSVTCKYTNNWKLERLVIHLVRPWFQLRLVKKLSFKLQWPEGVSVAQMLEWNTEPKQLQIFTVSGLESYGSELRV